MLSAREIYEYVHGKAKPKEKEQFSLDEAKQIGGSLGIDWQAFDVQQFVMGLNVELEHGRRNPETDVTRDDPVLTGKIVLSHLRRIPDYYTRLAVMERDASEQSGMGRV